jgi:hypothetical protein
MSEPSRRAPDKAGNRRGDAAAAREPAEASTGAATRPGAEPAALSAAPGEVPGLATPTLAALYASQGYAEMAAAIYAQLGQGGQGLPPGKDSGSAGAPGQPSGAMLEKLLALRRAARRRRAQTRGANPPPLTEDGADGR